jgi:cytochrome o ubiquinol oxidase subunit II
VVSASDFSGWAEQTGKAPAVLDGDSYTELARQSVKVPPTTYRLGDEGLFHRIVSQEIPPGPGPQPRPSGQSASSDDGHHHVR